VDGGGKGGDVRDVVAYSAALVGGLVESVLVELEGVPIAAILYVLEEHDLIGGVSVCERGVGEDEVAVVYGYGEVRFRGC
jgi:hypothetical protein